MVTHDIDEAVRLGERIIVFDQGKVVQDATPEEVLANPANDFVRALVGGEAASLRLLKVRRVRDWLSRDVKAEGPPIRGDEHLDTALARMLGSGRDALPVVDKAGKPLGAIGLSDLLRRVS
jgi:osmoprotectant transport system ATP-binding protein